MRVIDSDFIELAVELIDEFAETDNATWVSLADNVASDITEPWIVAQSVPTSTACKIVFVTIERDSHEFRKYRFDQETTDGKVLGLFYKTTFEPKIKDIATWNGRQLKVLALDQITPFENVILYIAEFAS